LPKAKIKNILDDSTILYFGSLFRNIKESVWYINTGLFPEKKNDIKNKNYLKISQAKLLARQRILNSTEKVRHENDKIEIKINKSSDFESKYVEKCPALIGVNINKGEAKQNCFNFIDNNINIFLPQFELARVLFFHNAYLARSALQTSFFLDFNVERNNNSNAIITILDTSGYPKSTLNTDEARQVLSWILLDSSAKKSFESINKFQLLGGSENEKWRNWDFEFSPPKLDGTILGGYGKFNDKKNSFFIYEITEIKNLPNDIPNEVYFCHKSFSDYEYSPGETHGEMETPPDETTVDDEDDEPNSDETQILLESEAVSIGYKSPFNTTKINSKKTILLSGSKKNRSKEKQNQEVSTGESSILGDLPSADWSSVTKEDDNSDYTNLYKNNFKLFKEMINLLGEKNGCEITDNYIEKLTKVNNSSKQHLLNRDTSTPRCINIVHLSYNVTKYIILEVDMSDKSSHSLSTKLLKLNSIKEWDAELKKIKKLVVKNYLSWPNEKFKKICVKHWSISHPRTKSINKDTKEINKISNADRIRKWSKCVLQKLDPDKK